ncbi:scavenger mRNA decapping enzyme [Peniophora sp. CONT]|nr:scavenger mRNA decapping enzyme [Peniophora sp. CONT]
MTSSDAYDIRDFVFERILNEDPLLHTVTLLGSQKIAGSANVPAIVRIEKTALPVFTDGFVERSVLIESTDIYTWLFGWLPHSADNPDVKINVICPATETHIRKYSTQRFHIVRETPALYERIVKPYIDAFPASRTQWVEDIISGQSEASKVLFRSPPNTANGFLILPDMKWDLVTVNSLYLVAIATTSGVRSLRDLRSEHVPMLKSVKREAVRVAGEKWGLKKTELRLFVHYQPSYYHFHVHIVNSNYTGLQGMSTGQAHMLDDLISLLELDGTLLQRMTLAYSLGENHALCAPMLEAQAELDEV